MLPFLNRLQPRDQRALTILAFAVLAILVLQFAVFPMLDSAAKMRAEIPMKEKRLHKFRSLTSLVSGAETDWKAIEQRLAQGEKSLLESKTPALASAELQDRMKQMLAQQQIEPRGLSFGTVKALPAADGAYTAVPLSVTFECGVDQLANLLGSFSTGEKLLALESLNVDSARRDEKSKKVVSVRMVVHAVIPTEPPPEKDSGKAL